MLRSLFFSLFIFATANIQMGAEPPDYGRKFGEIIEKAAMRLQTVAEKRPLKLSQWNDSLEKMAQAVFLMASKGDPEKITALLEAARKSHPENSFAILLQAILQNVRGDQQKANKTFEEFLLKSRKYTELEETFLHWGEFHMLRRTVFEVLRAQKISFKGREAEIQAYIPYEQFFKYVMDPRREDWVMNVALVILILGGGVLLVIASLTGVDLSVPPGSSLLTMYVMIWIAYAVWIFDLAFGLPFGLSRTAVVPLFLVIVSLLILTMDLMAYLNDRRRPLEEGYCRCPHCSGIIVALSTECIHCRKKIPAR
jgi:hypothetical protein